MSGERRAESNKNLIAWETGSGSVRVKYCLSGSVTSKGFKTSVKYDICMLNASSIDGCNDHTSRMRVRKECKVYRVSGNCWVMG